MKSKPLFVFLCIICCIFTFNIQRSFADGIKNWYLCYKEDGQLPQTPDNGEYTEKYDVISLDRSGNKVIYLTFDAGYENGNVEKTLDILKENNVPGAFFVLPNIIRTSPHLIQRMNDEGHLICNHTSSHKNMGRVTDIAEFRKELEDNEAVLRDSLGIEMKKYYRPPEGAYSELNLQHAKELGYKTVFWSLAYADWDNAKQPNAKESLTKLLQRVHPGCVLLLHPTSSTNAAILDSFIVELKKSGYTFASLDDFPIRVGETLSPAL